MGCLSTDLAVNQSSGLATKLFLINFRVAQWVRNGRELSSIVLFPIYLGTSLLHRALELLFNCSIPFGVKLGAGVRWPHGPSGVFITRDAILGDGCVVLHQVTIGSNLAEGDRRRTPVLGKGVSVGVGAKIIGGVTIGDHARIGAQALVVRDVEVGGAALAPQARVLKAEEAG